MARKKSVVITGVSTGIGWGAIKVLTDQGFHVFGSVRKAADADRLKAAFGEAFTPLLFDVTDAAAVQAGAREVEAALAGAPLAGLVNNAGVAVAGPILYLPIDEWRQQLEVNQVLLQRRPAAAAMHHVADRGLAGHRVAQVGALALVCLE